MMRFGLVLLLAIAATGCTSWLAGQIVKAPGSDNTNYVTSAESREWFANAYGFQHLNLAVGPPEAELAVTIVEPRNYELEYEFLDYKNNTIELDVAINGPEKAGEARKPDKGTVIILPGLLQSRYTMTFWGIGFAQRGYRAALVDLRGHGESSGKYLTYGIQEARDTVQVIEALDAHGDLEPPVVLLGASYGAVTALMVAAQSDTVDAVIAFEPFTDAPSAIEHMARAISPLLSRVISHRTMADAIDKASRISGVDLRRARAIDAMRKVKVPVLLVHGQEDTWVPPHNSFELYRAANGDSSLFIIPDAGHMDLAMRYDQFSERVFEWLEDALGASASAVTSGTREVSPEVSS